MKPDSFQIDDNTMWLNFDSGDVAYAKPAKTERVRKHLRGQVDLLVHGHQHAMTLVSWVNTALLEIDKVDGRSEEIRRRWAAAKFEGLDNVLRAQESRIGRIRAEIHELKKSVE